MRDYISCFNQPKNQLHQVPETNIINAFITGVNDKDLIRNISRINNITTRKMFDSPRSTQAAKTPSTSTSASTSRALMTKQGLPHPRRTEEGLQRKGDFIANTEKGRGSKKKQNKG